MTIAPTSRMGRSGGRASKVSARLFPGDDAPNAAPVGPVGGQYKPLSDEDCKRIFDAALTLLSRLGLGEVPDAIRKLAVERGCEIDHHGRLLYSPSYIQDIIARSRQSLVLFGQHPNHDFEVRGSEVRFGTGGAAVRTLDLETGRYRASTLQDLYDFARLADRLENICWFTRCCVATEIPDIFDLDINTSYAIAAGTTKPIGTSFTLGEHVEASIELFDMILGSKGAFQERPFCKAHISPIISPMRYGEDAVGVAEQAVRFNMPINVITAAQAGATAPAPLAGMLAQSLAETLASLALIDLLKPGHPVIFSNWPLVVDLRTGSFSGGGGEIAALNAASAQLTNSLGLISGVASSMTDSKIPDAQAGFEKGITALAAGLAGGNLIYESAGMFGSLLGASFEGFVIDNEMLGSVQRIIRGVEVNIDTLDLDAIERAVRGPGHFLGGSDTLAAMRRDYHYPALSDRTSPDVWGESGGKDMREIARERARKILREHVPNHVSSEIDRNIRGRFNISAAIQPY